MRHFLYTFRCFEEKELLDRVNELVFDEELVRKVGRNARTTVERHYSREVNEEKLIQILESVIGSHR